MLDTIYKSPWTIRVLIFLAGMCVGYVTSFQQETAARRSYLDAFMPIRAQDTKLSFVRPLIAYDTPQATFVPEYADLKEEVNALVVQAQATGGVRTVSVYFRNLENGRWVGINEGITYHPASLLKVPLMIAYFKAREQDASLFERRITYTGDVLGMSYETPSSLVKNRSYSIRELLERMVIDSDNGATFALVQSIDPDLLAMVYRRLGVEDPVNDASYEISTKTYALFFRTLFNSTYLTPSASEEVLAILSRATYERGIVGGVPAGTSVAHKFGEHVLNQNDLEGSGVELHDCGIVYASEAYLLCVMTSADTVSHAEKITRDISALVYSFGNPEEEVTR